MKKKTILVAAIAVMLVAALVVGGTLAYFTDKSGPKENTFTVGNVAIDLDEPSWKEGDHTLVPGKFYAKDPTITVNAGSQNAYVFLKLDLNKYASLINLMGVDAYKNKIGGLEGDYPGFTAFVQKLADHHTLRAAVLDRWFKGINHADWKVMNLTELEAAVAAAENGENPTHLVVVLGYQKVVKANDKAQFMTAFGMPETVTASMFDGEDAYWVTTGGVKHSASNFNTNTPNAAGNPVPFKMTFTAYAIQADQIANLDAAYKALGGYNAFAN